MTGSLQVKHGKYYIVLNTYESGKRKNVWISTGLEEKGNKRKAEQKLREVLQTYEPKKPSADVLFSDRIRMWLNSVAKKVDVVTLQGYDVLSNTQILPYFDEKRTKLANVTTDLLQSFFDEKAKSGRKDGKGGLSPSTLRLMKNILNQTLNSCVRDGLIATNPCQFVELPRKERYLSHFYTAKQMQDLFEAAKKDPLYPLIRIAALYGLRRSELLGIQWDSIDFENNLLTIMHTVTKVTETVAKDKTKNASSRRSFPLIPEARAIFEKAKAEESENRALFRSAYHNNPYVFKWPDGQPISPDYVSKHFQKLLKKNGLPPIRFHELRHSCASLLLNNGFSLKDVQEWMGHSDIKMTANLYGHLDATRKQGMADMLSDSLCKKC